MRRLTIKRIIISIPDNSTYYKNLYPPIKAGFEEAGCVVIGKGGLIEPSDLLRLINNESPDIVFEMNRSKGEIPGFPPNLPHVCWLVDFWGRKPGEIQGSDILYTFVGYWVKRFRKLGAARYIDYLPPGVDERDLPPHSVPHKYDFTFLGHMPSPWSEEALNRFVVRPETRPPIKFRELNKHIEKYVLNNYAQDSAFDIIGYLNKKFHIDLS